MAKLPEMCSVLTVQLLLITCPILFSIFGDNMFFYLSKLLAFIISPIVWIFGLLLYSFFTKNEKRAKRLRISAILILYICSNPFLVDEAFRAWEPVTPDWDLMDTKYEAAIVLG